MKFVALLRGINVGGNHKVEMKKLKALFGNLNCSNISTYINSGNVIFESNQNKTHLSKEIPAALKKEFGFEIPTLIKTKSEMKKIAKAIPPHWTNDEHQRTDIAYLFAEIDSPKTIDELPIKKEYMDIRYTKGAIIWNIDRKNHNKSRLNKLVSHKLYKRMTLRNVNTALFLANPLLTIILTIL